MMIWGRVIATVLGAMVGGFIGAIIGYIIGSYFDRSLVGLDQAPPQAKRDESQRSFFETTFLVLGHLAKSDGRISEQEIASTESFMGQMGLTPAHRAEAIALFKRGAQADFSLDDTMIAFLSHCGHSIRLQRMLLEYLVHLAFADGVLHQAERDILSAIARWLKIPARQFDQLLNMFSAQQNFAGATAESNLETAYAALGVQATVSDRELKRAYRKLMSEHHPDKLIARGVPQDMINLATEKAQEITAAYDTICKARGL